MVYWSHFTFSFFRIIPDVRNIHCYHICPLCHRRPDCHTFFLCFRKTVRHIGTNDFVAFTRIQNMTGQPAMSVPLHWNEGNIPIGVQFAGRFGDEGMLFRLAAAIGGGQTLGRQTPGDPRLIHNGV